jgi:cell division initiation protein
MPLTPLDAEKARFRVGFRGYAREEVERFRATVVAALEDHIAQGQQLKAKVGELEAQLARYRETEELLKNSVVLAQRTCDELIAAAHQKADAIRREALLEGDGIRRELAELRSQREQFEYAFHGLLTGFKHRLEQGNPRLAAPAERRQLAGGPAAAQTDEDETEQLLRNAAEAAARPAQDEVAAQASPAVPEAAAGYAGPPPASRAAPAASRSRSGSEVDRDADIADFSAALEQAPSTAPAWLGEEPGPPAASGDEDDSSEPAEAEGAPADDAPDEQV